MVGKMTKFELNTLETLLFMYQKKLQEEGAKLLGEEVKHEKVEEIITMAHKVEAFLSLTE